MILIDDKLIGDEIIEAHFVCDLSKCKGGCCEDGDAGAPLEYDELLELDSHIEEIKLYMNEAGIQQIEADGLYLHTKEFGWVTPTINGGICAYGKKNEKGIILCAIEQAYNDKKLDWKKPISCHLFPIRVSNPDTEMELLNYEPREEDHLCNPACKLGEELKVPVYQFLKEPIIRKYGTAFFEALDATAKHLNEEEEDDD